MDKNLDKKNIQALTIGILGIFFVGVFFIAKSFWSADEQATSTDNENSPQTAEGNRKTLTTTELQAKMTRNEKLLLVDIRTPEEYNTKHIPKSRSFPSDNLTNFQKEDGVLTVIIGSVTNPEANALAQEILANKNIEAWFLAGGFEEWSAKGFPVISQGNPRDFVDQSKVTFITKENLTPLIGQANVLVLDTQSEENFQKKHIRGALHIPLQEIEKRVSEINSTKRIVVYGENELESFRAGVRLFDLNFFGVETLRGNDHLNPGSPLPLEP